MYGAFGDKMLLFNLTLEKYSADVLKNTHNRLEKCKDTGKEIQSILTETADSAVNDNEHKGCFIVNTAIELAPHNELALKIVRSYRKKLEAIFTDAVKNAVERNAIQIKTNPEAIGKLLCTTLSGIYTDSKYLRSEKYFTEIIDAVMSAIILP